MQKLAETQTAGERGCLAAVALTQGTTRTAPAMRSSTGLAFRRAVLRQKQAQKPDFHYEIALKMNHLHDVERIVSGAGSQS